MNAEDKARTRLRGVSIAGSVSLAVLLVFATLRSRSGEPTETATKRPARRMVVEAGPEATVESPAPSYVATPVFEKEEQEAAWAMDATVARDTVARLKMAAACADLPARESATKALARYGRTARSLLDQEIAVEPDPVVRVVLQEARSSLK